VRGIFEITGGKFQQSSVRTLNRCYCQAKEPTLCPEPIFAGIQPKLAPDFKEL